MEPIVHITSRQDWQLAKAQGIYRSDSLETEGFIHCSTLDQVIPVANAFYRGRADLVLLCIDVEQVRSPIKVEPPIQPGTSQPDIHSNDCYPHIYGSLNLDAVINVVNFPPNLDGTFALPVISNTV